MSLAEKYQRAVIALRDISITSKGHPNGSREGKAAHQALVELGEILDASTVPNDVRDDIIDPRTNRNGVRLLKAGFTRWSALAVISERELMDYPCIGPRCVVWVKTELAARGLSFNMREPDAAQ